MFGGEIDAGYANSSSSGFSADIWSVGGSLFWAPAFGRVGGSVAYATTNSGGNANIVTFGGFGEYFASNFFTRVVRAERCLSNGGVTAPSQCTVSKK